MRSEDKKDSTQNLIQSQEQIGARVWSIGEILQQDLENFGEIEVKRLNRLIFECESKRPRMLFNSLEFALFLPIVFGLYWLLKRSRNAQNVLLLVAS